MTSTRLMFFCLAIASFAPVATGLQPGWWAAYYYGALLVCWVWMSVARVRRAIPEHQKAEHPLDARLRPLPDTEKAGMAGRHAPASDDELAPQRLIIVAREQPHLYDTIRRVTFRDNAVRVITDRRRTERRRQLEVYIPDRRRGERRRHDIAPLLLKNGWAQVPRYKRVDNS